MNLTQICKNKKLKKWIDNCKEFKDNIRKGIYL